MIQTWQAELLAMAALLVLSSVLREKESPESKALNADNRAMGDVND